MFVILSLVSCFMVIILKGVFITHTVLFLHAFSYINDIILYVLYVLSNFIYINGIILCGLPSWLRW